LGPGPAPLDALLDGALVKILQRRRPSVRSFVALEGPVCAGKTTVAKSLGSVCTRVVPEYLDLPGAASRVGVDAPAAGDGLRRLRLLLEIERHRVLHLPRMGSIVLDRSVFTLIAYEAGLAAMSGPNVLCAAAEEVADAIERGAVALPDRVVFLDCPAASCVERAAAAGMRTPTFLFDAAFRCGFRQVFFRLERAAPGTVLFVDADRPVGDVVKEVCGIVNGSTGR
jgi:thymidylate kinase